MTINVILVLYNSEQVINRCLRALSQAAQNADILCNVYCVDNQPDLSWPNLNFQQHFPHLKMFLIRSDSNSGFSGGCRVAIEQYNLADSLLLLNPDAFMTPDFFVMLERDIRKFDGFEDVLIGTRAVSEDGVSPTRNAGKMPEVYAYANYSIITPGSVFYDMRIWPLAACLYIKSTKKFTDLFDMPFFLTMEEPALVRSMSPVVAFSAATVIHEGGHSYDSLINELQFHAESLDQYQKLFFFSFSGRLKLMAAITKLRLLIMLHKLFQGARF